jgi:hypothetical protein
MTSLQLCRAVGFWGLSVVVFMFGDERHRNIKRLKSDASVVLHSPSSS